MPQTRNRPPSLGFRVWALGFRVNSKRSAAHIDEPGPDNRRFALLWSGKDGGIARGGSVINHIS